MRLHTSLPGSQVFAALSRAQRKGLIAPDIDFTVYKTGGSKTHPFGYEIQLGTYDKYSLPAGYVDQHGKNLRVRRYRNSNHGDAEYAATWHEWGWFIAEVFAADPESRWGSDPSRARNSWGYSSPEDFRAKTDNAFIFPDTDEPSGRPDPVVFG
jgi:hypothetical protein